MAIKLLGFDLDDTLWPCVPVLLNAEKTVYAWLRNNVPEITSTYSMDELHTYRMQFMRANPQLQANLTEARKTFFRELSAQQGIAADWVEPAFAVFHTARQQVSLFDDVAEVLDDLKTRYRMAAISNGNADIDKTGVAHWFEFHITAEKVGQAKPHPSIFETFLERAGVDAEESVIVGDDPHRDIYGASRFGIKTIWVNRQAEPWVHAECRPDAEVIDFANLPDTLERLEAAS